jgi:hypothetical protein
MLAPGSQCSHPNLVVHYFWSSKTGSKFVPGIPGCAIGAPSSRGFGGSGMWVLSLDHK